MTASASHLGEDSEAGSQRSLRVAAGLSPGVSVSRSGCWLESAPIARCLLFPVSFPSSQQVYPESQTRSTAFIQLYLRICLHGSPNWDRFLLRKWRNRSKNLVSSFWPRGRRGLFCLFCFLKKSDLCTFFPQTSKLTNPCLVWWLWKLFLSSMRSSIMNREKCHSGLPTGGIGAECSPSNWVQFPAGCSHWIQTC